MPPSPPLPPPPPPGRVPGREPPPSAPGSGYRQAYGLLNCPGIVVVDQEFELVVGLTEDVDDEELSDAMTIFPEDTIVDVTVRAPGCVIRPGETWRQPLAVRADKPLPVVTLHLTVPGTERYRPSRTIKAVYSVPGRTLGLAIRSFAVARTEADVTQTTAPKPAGTATVSPPVGPRNDLEIIVQHEGSGILSWDFTSANPDVKRLDAPVTKPIGNYPDRFAKYLLETVDAKADDVDLAEAVRGFGRIIAETIPSPVWTALGTVAAAAPAGESPNVLILSDEPYIPWELALTERPLRPGADDGPDVPSVLGAQVRIGRWVIASQRPKSPPPSELTVEQMAVISGRYRRGIRIKEAEQEASDLRGKYHAADVAAMLPAVTKCLKGQPRAEAIHFALHGRYSPDDHAKDGLLLVDGKVLQPIAVSGHTLDQRDDRRPLVFLNACQAGTGDAILGVYTGMGGAFLTAGAAAVIAPLWSVDDGKARSVAVQFYEQVLLQGLSPAEFIRRLRAKFRNDADVVDVTPLAYQFFGHPQLRVIRQQVS